MADQQIDHDQNFKELISALLIHGMRTRFLERFSST
jgi:hypothetical protein